MVFHCIYILSETKKNCGLIIYTPCTNYICFYTQNFLDNFLCYIYLHRFAYILKSALLPMTQVQYYTCIWHCIECIFKIIPTMYKKVSIDQVHNNTWKTIFVWLTQKKRKNEEIQK